MAAHTDAAASLSPDRTVFWCFLSCKSQCFCTSSSRLPVFKRAYSHEFLLDVGRTSVELTDVFTDILNISLNQAVVPTCFKATTIIPVPKKSSPSCFNDYHPVALTPILMKCFEQLVMQHIKSVLPPSLDPFQFAYRSNRSTDDAIATVLHPALTHLDKKDTYVRLLFIDFSSAFNTIIPQQLIHKLIQLGLNTSLCNWLLDFLTGRPQAVRVGSNTSSTITLNTGAPQGCVLSPLLFTLLTHDCTPSHNSNLFIKFADDKGDHVTHRQWCRLSFSLRSLCHIFYDPVSKIWTTLH